MAAEIALHLMQRRAFGLRAAVAESHEYGDPALELVEDRVAGGHGSANGLQVGASGALVHLVADGDVDHDGGHDEEKQRAEPDDCVDPVVDGEGEEVVQQAKEVDLDGQPG